jgi:hypothetical protein
MADEHSLRNVALEMLVADNVAPSPAKATSVTKFDLGVAFPGWGGPFANPASIGKNADVAKKALDQNLVDRPSGRYR